MVRKSPCLRVFANIVKKDLLTVFEIRERKNWCYSRL